MSDYLNKIKSGTTGWIYLLMFLLSVYSCEQEVFVSPPDEPPPDGVVFIDSNPRGAHIYLNGKDRRRITPDSLTWLETNGYSITLKMDLYRDTSITVEVTEGQRSNYFVDYTKNPLMRGKINCTGKPGGSEIFLNGVSTGLLTPAVISNLLPGRYSIRYRLFNHRDDSVTVTVSSNTTTEARTTLVDTTIWADLQTSNSSIPTNNLTCILIDKNDVLWIGTADEGLLRYDGSVWTKYTPINSLLQDYKISSICFDSERTLWVGNKFGVFLLGENFMEKYNNIGIKPFTDSDIKSIASYRNGLVYIASNTNTVLSLINFYGYRDWLPKTRTDYGAPSDNFTSVAVDSAGVLYAGTAASGMVIARSKIYGTNNSSILSNRVSTITPDPNGGVWIGYRAGTASRTGITYYNGTFNNFLNIPEAGTSINAIYIDNENIKWLGTNIGLHKYIGGNDVESFTPESTGLKINNVKGIVRDSKGRVWIATEGGGLILKKK